MRKQDIVARLGGDEFAVLSVDCNFEDGERMGKRIQSALALCQVDASLGVAVRNPEQGLWQAQKDADQAMYSCKGAKKPRSATSVGAVLSGLIASLL
ncbi:diguanylate cyclase [Leptolyngbya sp. FACHB-16]|nr:diguanylate cyclase [Leptolyngbya sp. FACHB-16]